MVAVWTNVLYAAPMLGEPVMLVRVSLVSVVAMMLFGSVVVMAQVPNDAQLDADLADLRRQISAALDDEKEYPGGIINHYIKLRIQILKSTESMIQQKRLAALRGITMVYRDDLPRLPTDLAAGEAHERDLAKAQDDLRAAELEASRYHGGLMKSVAEMRATTARATIAFIEQQKLLRRYGIPMPSLVQSNPITNDSPKLPGVVVPDKDAL